MIGDLDESKAPLLDHLIELRKRLLWRDRKSTRLNSSHG